MNITASKVLFAVAQGLAGLGIFTALAGTAFAQPVDLYVSHSEFADSGPDDLIWNGPAATWAIERAYDFGDFQTIDSQVEPHLGTFQYIAAAARSNQLVTYRVTGTDGQGNQFISPTASVQQFFQDPGFEDGAATQAWYSTRMHVGGDEYNSDLIAERIATLGGTVSEMDRVSTVNAMYITNLDQVTGQVVLSGLVATQSTEDPNDPGIYDRLEFDITDVNTGEIIETGTIVNNHNDGLGDQPFYLYWPYSEFAGRSVSVVFRSTNDEVNATTFYLQDVELKMEVQDQ